MVSVSNFRGITIHMYIDPAANHSVPHFRASFSKSSATFAIKPLALLAGEMPNRQMRFILAWAEIHQAELEENWRSLQKNRALAKIEGI
jgi:hypothetical protein